MGNGHIQKRTTMSDIRDLIAYNSCILQIEPDIEDQARQKLEKWTVLQLRSWLGMRGLRSSEACKPELVKLAYFAWKLKIPINPNEVTTQKEAAERLDQLLTCSDIKLPDPTTITKWSIDLKELPTVTYDQIYDYLIKAPDGNEDSRNAYKSLEAVNYVANGWVQNLHICKVTDDLKFVKAKVKPSQHTAAAHDPWVMLQKDGVIKSARCNCTSGLGEVCSHISAVLFKCMRAAELELNEPDACTSKACEWNNDYCVAVKPELIQKIDFRKPKLRKVRKRQPPKRKAYSSSSSSDDEAWTILAEAAPNAVGLHMLNPPKCNNTAVVDGFIVEHDVFDSDPIQGLPPSIKTIVDGITEPEDCFEVIRTSVSFEESQFIYDSTKEQSKNQLWHDIREKRLTASNMGKVHHYMESGRPTPSVTLMNTFLEPSRDLSFVDPIKWGNDHEGDALSLYTARCKSSCGDDFSLKECGLKIPAGDAHIGGTPDGIAECSCCGARLVEVKCPYTAGRKGLTPAQGIKEKCIPFMDEIGLLKKNHEYYIQVQGQLAVFGLEKCDFVVWSSDQICVETILFDEKLWQQIKSNLDNFYLRYIVPHLIPKKPSLEDLVAPPKKPTKRKTKKKKD